MKTKLKKILYLPQPRGFCAGVDRAINIVELSLKKYGAPIYVRHEIVHNPWVIKDLETKGVIFIEDLKDAPEGSNVIFSAHGIPKKVLKEAERKNMPYIDATCPLVIKVHNEAKRLYKEGAHIFLIGHEGHPEVIGTMGQIPQNVITLIQNKNDINKIKKSNYNKVALITQTTLSVDDTKEIIDELKKLFPNIIQPPKEDICYATTNRQMAIKSIAKNCDIIYVIGANNSSNSLRLVEVGKKSGCKKTFLISSTSEVDWEEIKKQNKIGLTASASAPDSLVQEFIQEMQDRFELKINNISVANENITFKIPKILNEC
ncbi:MAG: 4-hydroxy-3-methylbut-2-enyl diphosphate reductase [Pseudomonadota bacterium]|nr:4-hydroxy-3-methylbut-2-enyl diphosphate reductase [Pseudomonadota bacterium]MEC9458973.1 4-hydroxy-3-methylbut-2-enyl diphosphate reductase [Pseudomonadota bacterium]MEC9481264.1 4-hydroxy-3-methylbut-2-enyl diphosphate reductase [Pseudomonadota bacterium]